MKNLNSQAIQMGDELSHTRKPFLGSYRANAVIGVINAILKARITRGNTDAIFLAEKGGLVIQLNDGSDPTTPTASGTIQRFKITGITTDHLICRTFDGATTGSSDVLVAKQSNVRKSITNEIYLGLNWAVTYTGNASRTLTHAATSRTIIQALFPTYETSGTIQNGQIWAVQTTGGTGVAAAPDWLEIGPSRRWEFGLKELDVCQTIAGVPTSKKILLTGGELYT